MHTTRTAFLTDDWDLMLETDGTLKMCAGEIESVLQNCCNEIRLWLHDAYFRYGDGTDYKLILANKYHGTRLLTVIRQAILRVDSTIKIKEITVNSLDVEDRIITGKIAIEWRGEYGERNF